jgi:Uma2 family endonuclease
MTEVADPTPAAPAATAKTVQRSDSRQLTEPLLPMPLVLHMRPALDMNDEQFFAFCQQNREFRIERTAEGDLIIMSPVGGETGDLESELNIQLRLWAKKDGTGVAFSPSAGFILPNNAERSPDSAWVAREHLTALSPEQRKRFLPLCPDFVAELRSPPMAWQPYRKRCKSTSTMARAWVG